MPAQTDNKDFYLTVNSDYKDFSDSLIKLGYKILPIGFNVCLAEPVAKHSDMQYITIRDRTFVLPESLELIGFSESNNINYSLTKKASKLYPYDVLCNGKLVGDKFFCNRKTIDQGILDYALISDLKIIDVNQGYTGCSILNVDDNSIITSDKSIYNAAVSNNIEVLLINEGYIKIKDYNHGFIGGCSGKVGEKIIFSGSLDNHPNKNEIRDFIKSKNKEIIEFDFQLTDIGGIGVIDLHSTKPQKNR